jgi:hypothetical protein
VDTNPFDILRRENDGSFIWVEAAHNLSAAQARLKELILESPGEYLIFDRKTQQVIAKSSTESN